MSKFTSEYYDADYFASVRGKTYKKADGSEGTWGYKNETGLWLGADSIAKAWKEIFGLKECKVGIDYSKVLDVGAGRGQFVLSLRRIEIETWGFDFSQYAIDNPCNGCEKGWLIKHDATRQWPYGSAAFDLTVCLDLMEHLFLDDLEYVISEMYRVSKKWIFLQIATVGGGSGTNLHEKGYILKKGEDIPVELEGVAVAGHVTVQTKIFWKEKLENSMNNDNKFIFRDDLVEKFKGTVPKEVIANWVKNTIIVLERLD